MPLPIEGQQPTLSHKNQVGRSVRSDADSSQDLGERWPCWTEAPALLKERAVTKSFRRGSIY